MINIKKLLRGRKDQELIVTRSEARAVVRHADRGYTSGDIDPILASDASDAAEIVTVANAEIRRRVESSGSGSHLRLQDSEAISPKRIDRGWGSWLSSRRRA